MYCMQTKSLRKPTISLRLPPHLLREVDDLVSRTKMHSRTDLVQRAVEAYIQDLKDTKVIVLRQWTDKNAKAAVMKLLKERTSANLSEIVEALGMDPDLALRTVENLAKEGRIE